MEVYYKAMYHFENVPLILQDWMAKAYMKHRSEAVKIFNEHIDRVNKEWNLLGKPTTFGDYVEDINPEYCEFINRSIQPYIDDLNKKLGLFCKYRLGEYADIEGYLPLLKKIQIMDYTKRSKD